MSEGTRKASTWTTATLADVAVFRGGNGFPERYQGRPAGLHPFIKVSDLNEPGNERQVRFARNWLTDDILKQIKPTLHPPGAVVFAKVGAALKLNRRRTLIRPTAIDNNMMSVEAGERLNPAFLFALMETLDLAEFCQDGGLPSVNQTNLGQFEFLLPPLEEQRRITEVLQAWDEAVATTERLVDAKRRRLTTVRKTLFLDLADAEVPLSELAEVATGVPAPQNREAFAESGPRFVRVSDLAAFAGEQPDEPEYLDPGFARTARLRLFPPGTILFAKSGMSATLARVLRLPVPAHIVSHLGAVNARTGAHQAFLYHWLTEHPPSSLLQGDGFPSIRISEVGSLPVPNVGVNRAAEIGDMLDTFEADVKSERRRVDFLRFQKRGLLQKLLTGTWRVPPSVDTFTPGRRLVSEAAE